MSSLGVIALLVTWPGLDHPSTSPCTFVPTADRVHRDPFADVGSLGWHEQAGNKVLTVNFSRSKYAIVGLGPVTSWLFPSCIFLSYLPLNAGAAPSPGNPFFPASQCIRPYMVRLRESRIVYPPSL